MSDWFKVKDTTLLECIFKACNPNNESSGLDIREICATIIFHMRGSLDDKFILFFKIMKNRNIKELSNNEFVLKSNVMKIIDDALASLKGAFYTARIIANEMNTKLDGRISY
jgi:hypothetical protein